MSFIRKPFRQVWQFLGLFLVGYSLFSHRCNVAAWSTPRKAAEVARRKLLIQISTACLVTKAAPSRARNLPESTGASGTKVGAIEALILIVKLRNTFVFARSKLSDWNSVSSALSQIPHDELHFKQLFDEYSDPVSYKQKFLDQNAFLVYYTKGFDGPNRPGIENDLPEKQTMQFGARNEAWVAWNELQAELEFVRNHPNEDNDVAKLLDLTIQAVNSYLQLAPSDDVNEAAAQLSPPYE